MRFERVRLENFKCYGDADLTLDSGVTVIHGLNGSGKSSLLEACFFALYGARALDETLDEVVTIGAEDATVELWFSHGGGSYHVERRVRVTDDRATTAKCVLETPEATYEGARDVRGHVGELLRMDHEAFVNCAYVRQGEVNKLINASPADRQDMIDDLLQLGKLEEYRERASKARLGVKHVRDGKRELLDDLAAQIERKAAQGLHDRLNALQTERKDLEAEIERFDENRQEAVKTRDEAAAVLEEHEEKRERLQSLETEIEELTGTIEETERERERLGDRIGELKAEIEEIEAERDDLLAESELDEPDEATVSDTIADLETRDEQLRDDIEDHRVAASEHTSEAESLGESAADLETRAKEKRQEAEELASELAATREKLAQRREQIERLEADIEAKREVFEDAPVVVGEASDHWDELADELNEARERQKELETRLEAEQRSLDEAEQLLDAGKCPECGQPVEDSPHVESIDEHRERIDDLQDELVSVRQRRERLEDDVEDASDLVDRENELRTLRNDLENVEQLVQEKEDGLDDTVEKIDRLREEAEELDAEAEAKREAAEEAESAAAERREAVAECNEERAEIGERLDRLEAIEETFERAADREDEIERLREQRTTKTELNDERRDRLSDKRDQRDELDAEFDESAVEQAREEKKRAVEYIEKVEPKLEELRAERDDLLDEIGGVKQEIEELEELRERHEDLEETVERLESLYSETEQLQEMYGQLRAELRQRNVESLERMLNETFDLIYGNDSYSRIELDGEYELTVYQKDGQPLDPEQLSGGERALFNLSLRCAIYQLLAEGIEGAAPMPPLILDEPTVFLDSGHVSRLVDLIRHMHDLGVEQILVVSHDEELFGAADDLVMVSKDATTNRSTVARKDPDEATREAVADAATD
ncbi:DNA double-strand break repair ATPase Rad50 [Halorientalis pallida]|uniref:DNA double-strand break repair Rad50 ATPase n=1 Tax=Halorientalis pallida TaxID=2479928 RepID=A0A498KWR6_9EURY|nr:DNA double-strand break repair ATPase Rad50 [Halorientalis pallida]RXK46179.1 DNA double-strand break repair Rad50 ATPase [Halorientalis pallida]